ncbi:N-acetylgalactosamine-6-sulfatase-like isoform X1 [Dermacentor variabilis]|uniref:N-acetylgalactosamine-6-sulfatase-like isoform X1 n=1 Tax=Dermacentor variabilis TaxID=34621 RepID=UPI003F5B7801
MPVPRALGDGAVFLGSQTELCRHGDGRHGLGRPRCLRSARQRDSQPGRDGIRGNPFHRLLRREPSLLAIPSGTAHGSAAHPERVLHDQQPLQERVCVSECCGRHTERRAAHPRNPWRGRLQKHDHRQMAPGPRAGVPAPTSRLPRVLRLTVNTSGPIRRCDGAKYSRLQGRPHDWQEAVSFIRRQAARRQPFFLYWAPDSTHLPVYSSEAVRGQSVRGAYGDAVVELDRGVGAILAALRSTGVAENTFVFFTSDNGAATYAKVDGGSNGPLLCGKQTTFEGGVREPAIAWWPGTIPAGMVSRRPASNMDVLPTIAELAGATLPPGLVLDGHSLLGRVLGRDEPPSERPIFYYRGNELMAIRSGLYKAHFWCWTEFREEFQRGLDFCPGQSVDGVTSHEQLNYTQQPVLFHLGLDPGEKFPIPPHSSEYGEKIGPILAIYHKHRRSLVPGKPQLDWCDDAAMQWAPPGCEKIDRCLPVPRSRPYRCSWLY